MKENLKKDANFLSMENLFCLRSHMYRNYRSRIDTVKAEKKKKKKD